MAERSPGRRTAREATNEDSRGRQGLPGVFGRALSGIPSDLRPVLLLGVLAAVLMVVAELSTVASVDVAAGSCEVINDSSPELADRCSLSGLERHGGALILVALFVLAMTWGATAGASRPAGAALLVSGLVVIGIALLLDLPEADETGAIGRSFEGAEGKAGLGLWLSFAAGAAAALAGMLRLGRR